MSGIAAFHSFPFLHAWVPICVVDGDESEMPVWNKKKPNWKKYWLFFQCLKVFFLHRTQLLTKFCLFFTTWLAFVTLARSGNSGRNLLAFVCSSIRIKKGWLFLIQIHSCLKQKNKETRANFILFFFAYFSFLFSPNFDDVRSAAMRGRKKNHCDNLWPPPHHPC